MRIAYNAFLQELRKDARTQRLVEVVRATDDDRTVAAPNAETLIDLPLFLEVLSDDERVTMILCYAHGYSHAEISEITAMPLGTVKSHIRRGRVKIEDRFELKECG